MENRIVIYQIFNGEAKPLPERTPQEKIEIAYAERVGGVYFTTTDELEKYIEKTRGEKYLRKQKMRVYRDNCGLLIDEAATLLGILKTYLVKIENDEKDPTLEFALKSQSFIKQQLMICFVKMLQFKR